MRQFTDAEELLMLYAIEARSGSKAPQDEVQKRIKISRPKATALIKDGGNLKNAALRKRLNDEFGKIFVEPGSIAYRARYTEVKLALGETEDGRQVGPNIKAIDRYYIELAYGPWAEKALDPTVSDAESLLSGRMAYKVMDTWLRLAGRRRAEGAELFIVPDEKVAERARAVINAMVAIVANHLQQPPAGLFQSTNDVACRNGYRMYRILLDSDHSGISITKDTTVEDRVKHLAAAYKRGLAGDLVWLRAFRKSEIACSYNPWVLSMHASDWNGSLSYAETLFRDFPDVLTKTGQVKAVVDDPDTWPGITAIMEDYNHEGLDSLREVLNSGSDAKVLRMMEAVAKARPVIAKGGTYVEALKAMGF